MEFQSRSADDSWKAHKRNRAVKDQTVIQVIRDPSIYIIGKVDDGFVKYGTNLGLEIKELTRNRFNLFGARHLIYYELSSSLFSTKMRFFNFAINYSIPVSWIHSYVVPYNWMCQFNNIIVGDFKFGDVWRQICELD